MHNFYRNMIPEERKTWRNAYEIKIAALEHEKQRYQMIGEETSLAKPQVTVRRNRNSGWAILVNASLRLLAILMG
jgi:hypothetical protein